MTHNAFEDDRPLFSENDLPMFEQIQRALPDEGVDDAVKGALKELPPTEDQAQGIAQNIDKLKEQGLWATARFYERLLEQRDSTEG